MSEPDPAVPVTIQVVEVLDRLGVRSIIGGSLAIILHGAIRTTNDADLVTELRLDQAEAFARALERDFYVDVESIRDAIRRRASFNVIHLESMFKVDVFISRGRPFDVTRFQRAVRKVVATEPERAALVSTPEDMILVKLAWFRDGGEVSERQWRDVLGVIKAQGDRLDGEYLRKWAPSLGVLDLLDRAFEAAVT